jgi:adenylate cyclase
MVSQVSDVANWLIDGARSTQRADHVLKKLCDDLCACGIPLWRVAVFVRTLHPDIFGRSFVWRPDTEVVVSQAPHTITTRDDYLKSPILVLYETGKPVRHRLTGPPAADEIPFLTDLRAENVTDYIAMPLAFTDGSLHAVTWSTKHPGGFTDEHLAALQQIVGPFARVAEIRALQRTAGNLLDTYVGNNAGARILAGQIRRGHTEKIHAAIWLSDMRGFTTLSDRLPPETVVDVLNRYFDCQVPVVIDHGGEVLKFMGDGLLAIFPIASDDSDIDEVCGRVLDAARVTRANVDTLSAANSADLGQSLRFGLALHVGEVLYGNIGAVGRLDFTCIGPAVNLAARLEKVAAGLGRTVIASARFARQCQSEVEELGEFSVAGFAAAQTAYGLRDDARGMTPPEPPADNAEARSRHTAS